MEEKKEEIEREGLREALIAIITTAITFSVLSIGAIAQKIALPSPLQEIIFLWAPFLLSFIIFYRFSKNIKKSILVAIVGGVFWLSTLLIIALLLLSGWH